MEQRKIVLLALAALLPATAQASPPDLCEDVVLGPTGSPYTDSYGNTISKWCEPRVNPPVLDSEVCCVVTDEANCIMPDAIGRCSIGMKFSCEYGEQNGDGVACYQPGPSTCELGVCEPGSYNGGGTVFESSSWVCCDIDFVCVYVGEGGMTPPDDAECDGSFTICNHGATNEDGTVSCFD